MGFDLRLKINNLSSYLVKNGGQEGKRVHGVDGGQETTWTLTTVISQGQSLSTLTSGT